MFRKYLMPLLAVFVVLLGSAASAQTIDGNHEGQSEQPTDWNVEMHLYFDNTPLICNTQQIQGFYWEATCGLLGYNHHNLSTDSCATAFTTVDFPNRGEVAHFRVKPTIYLGACQDAIVGDGNPMYVPFYSMKGGDANNDNYINIQDFNIMRQSYGYQYPDPNYNLFADFDSDRFVDIRDFGEYRNNQNYSGCPGLR